MTSSANASIFAIIDQAEDTLRERMLGDLAAVRKVPVSALEEDFKTFRAKNADKLARNKKKAERKALEARLKALSEQIKGLSLTGRLIVGEIQPDRSGSLASFVARIVADKGVVTINPDLSLSVSLPQLRKSGTGGGKPAANAVRPWTDQAGRRIVGPLTTWLDSNFSKEEQAELGVFRPNGKRRSGADLAKYLVRAGVLTKVED